MPSYYRHHLPKQLYKAIGCRLGCLCRVVSATGSPGTPSSRAPPLPSLAGCPAGRAPLPSSIFWVTSRGFVSASTRCAERTPASYRCFWTAPLPSGTQEHPPRRLQVHSGASHSCRVLITPSKCMLPRNSIMWRASLQSSRINSFLGKQKPTCAAAAKYKLPASLIDLC